MRNKSVNDQGVNIKKKTKKNKKKTNKQTKHFMIG